MSDWMIVLAFFLGLIIMLLLITIHELGHFIVAKMSGAYVYEFSIGFGPRLYCKKGKETWFSIRAFPLGGYCSIASDKVDPPDERADEEVPPERMMEYIVRWKKALFILAGPLMNLAMALIIILMTITIAGHQLNDMQYFGAKYSGASEELIKDSKSEDGETKFDYSNIDLQQVALFGWKVTEKATETKKENIIFDNIDGDNKFKDYVIAKKESVIAPTYDVTVNTFLKFRKDFATDENDKKDVYLTLYFKVLDNLYTDHVGSKMFVTQKKDVEYKISDAIGIAAPTRYFKTYGESFTAGLKTTWDSSISLLKGFGMLITGQWNAIAGPVGAARQTASMLTSPEQFFLFVGGISANLFMLNILFVPPLDGYKFLENLIEACMRRELNKKVKLILNIVGATLFLLLFVGITIKDFIV